MIFMKTQSNFYLFLIALISAMGGFLFGSEEQNLFMNNILV